MLFLSGFLRPAGRTWKELLIMPSDADAEWHTNKGGLGRRGGTGETPRDIIKGWFPEPCAFSAGRGVTDGRTRHNLRLLTGEMKNIRLKNGDRKQDGQRSLGSFFFFLTRVALFQLSLCNFFFSSFFPRPKKSCMSFIIYPKRCKECLQSFSAPVKSQYRSECEPWGLAIGWPVG